MDYKLVAPADIEYLSQGECAHQFHAAQILLEEARKSGAAARVQELENFINEVRPRVSSLDLEPAAVAKVRAIVSGQHLESANLRCPDATELERRRAVAVGAAQEKANEAATNPAPAESVSPAS